MEVLSIKIKRLHPNAKLPTKATDGSCGYDLYAAKSSVEFVGSVGTIRLRVYDTGISMTIPKGYVGLLFPRSSISKTSLNLANSVGVLDSDYTGPITFKFKDSLFFENCNQYSVGDRVGQLLVVPVNQLTFEEVDVLQETKRGGGGYGSTGR